MAKIINTTFQLKRGTQQRWIEVNPILAQGEPGFEYDTGKLKIGDGLTPWNKLPYVNPDINIDPAALEEVVVVENFDDLPRQGDPKKTYRVIADKMLYQWNNNGYEGLAIQGSLDPTIITLINGGNANG